MVLEGDEGNPQPCGHAEMRPAQGHFLFRANDPVFSDVWYPRSRYKDEIERIILGDKIEQNNKKSKNND